MPVSRKTGRKRPAHAVRAQSPGDVRVLIRVILIVVIDILEMAHRPVHRQCDQRQRDRDGPWKSASGLISHTRGIFWTKVVSYAPDEIPFPWQGSRNHISRCGEN